MSLSALFSQRPFRPDRQNMEAALNERCPGETIGFVSVGGGGLMMGTIKLTGSGPTIRHLHVDTQVPTFNDMPAIAARLRKQIGRLGPAPVIACSSFGLEWSLKRNQECKSTAAFVRQLRTEANKILGGGYAQATSYLGLLQLQTSSGLVFGVSTKEMDALADALTAAKCEVVRRTIPAMAVFNLVLASDAVLQEQRIPLIIDQGFAVAVVSEESGWREVMARQISHASNGLQYLDEMLDRISNQVSGPKFVVACSPVNGGRNVEEYLKQRSVDFTTFSVGAVKQEHLFAHATALF